MFMRTLTWAFLAGVLVLALALSGSMLSRAAAEPHVDLAPAQGDTVEGTADAAAGSIASWRSNGPYGGNVQALALSPAFNTDGFAFAGGWLGDGSSGGYGIMRTTDGGASWQPWGGEGQRWAVFDLAISPGFSSDNTVYAATDVGLLRSSDRGENWMTLWGGLPTCETGSICSIARVRLSPDFADDDLLFAMPRGAGGSAVRLYRSTDRGDSWTQAIADNIVLAVTFSRDFAANQTVYAAVTQGADAVGVLRSTDAGVTWSPAWSATSLNIYDLLETVEGSLLLATSDGVTRLIPDAGGFVEAAVAVNIPGTVNRLITGGDNIYAAAQDGLYISLSFGRGWDRYADTPQTPFRAVAWGGGGRVLMAGTYTGMIYTPDDNLTPWTWQKGLKPIDAQSVAAYGEHMLFVAGDLGVYRSTDSGATWEILTTGAPLGHNIRFLAVQPSPAYATDNTIFATFVDFTLHTSALYKSTDGGATWTVITVPGVYQPPQLLLALSNNYLTDQTVFVAGWDQLHKSTDGGATWATHSIAPSGDFYVTYKLAASPAYGSDQTLFATGPDRMARRSTDGGVTWSAVGGPAPTYGLAMSPSYAADGTAWLTYRFREGVGDGTPDSGVTRTTNRGATWSLSTAGLPGDYASIPIPLAASPSYNSDKTLFTALSGNFDPDAEHSLYRAIGGGNWWVNLGAAPGNPSIQDLAVTALGPAGGLTAHAATSEGVWHCDALCEERLINGGFETADGWLIKSNPVLAGYVTTPVHSGSRSMRTGIAAGATNVLSYSPIEQAVTFPTGLASATLSFWRYNVNGDWAPPLRPTGSLTWRRCRAPKPSAPTTSRRRTTSTPWPFCPTGALTTCSRRRPMRRRGSPSRLP